MALVQGLCGAEQDEEILRLLCANACEVLDGLLRDGVKVEDCGSRYQLAAAWIVMDWLKECGEGAEITALSAGDLTVRREGGSGKLFRRAMELMAPYIRDPGFVFRGVRG